MNGKNKQPHYEIFIREFCPNSGYTLEMTDEEALALTECEKVGRAACRTHGYDPYGELNVE